jgi:hypothetical protein
LTPPHLWDDVVHGSAPTAAYDDVNHPIQVLDRDTITQRVALIFTSATTGNIAFEELGIIGTFNTSTNVAPVNPATGNPYFVLDHLGFGTGWATATRSASTCAARLSGVVRALRASRRGRHARGRLRH